MLRYIGNRISHSAIVVVLVVSIVFVVVRSIPGDPAITLLGGSATQAAIESLQREMGLNEPLYIQYIIYLQDIASGDFGRSFFYGQPVLNVIAGVAEPTISIAVLSMIFALIVAIPAGIISAVRQYSLEDHIATIAAFVGFSVPGFFVGILFVALFTQPALNGLLPIYGYVPISQGIVPWFKHLLLPALAVGIPIGGILMRMIRSAMLEVLNESYMRTAKAKGLAPNLVILKHGFQNAMLPVITLVGIYFAVLLVGVVTIEIVFGIQGFGRVLVRSIERRDFLVVQASVIIISIIFVLMNLFVDILYAMIDPRIQYGDQNG